MAKRSNRNNSSRNNNGNKGKQNGNGYKKNGFTKKSNSKEPNDEDTKMSGQASLPHILPAGDKDNDVSWYKNIPGLAENYASLPFSIPAGTKWDILRGSSYANLTSSRSASIMVLDVVPTVGPAQSATDPVNLAAQQIYTLDRKANSGATNYDSTDVMLVMLAMDSAYMLYEELCRAYKLVGKYDDMNRAYPSAVLDALGFDHSFLMRNYKDFKGLLDTFAFQLGAINVPDQIDYIKRHSWLFSNLYTDAEGAKSQIYAFKPASFYVWTEGTGTGANAKPTYLKLTTRASLYGAGKVDSMDKVWNAIDKIMQPILGSADIGTISGDLAKAFGENGMININLVNDGEAIEPYFSKEVLMEIENSIVFSQGSLGDITVNYTDLTTGPYLVQNPPIVTVEAGLGEQQSMYTSIRPIMNMHHTGVSSDDVLAASRFIYDVQPSEGTQHDKIKLNSYATEILTGMHITYVLPERNSKQSFSNNSWLCIDFKLEAENPGQNSLRMNFLKAWMQFDWAPMLQLWYRGNDTVEEGTPDYYEFVGYGADIDNVQVLSEQTIKDLNYACVLSLFKVKDY